MSLARFAEHVELSNVYNQYVDAYEQLQQAEQRPWGTDDSFRLIRAADGAAVYYTPETTLFGGSDQRKQYAPIAKTIGSRLMDCAAYFLAQGISVDQIPDTLRISMAVCHGNVHWTGAEVNVTTFKAAYTHLAKQFKDQQFNSYNDAKNHIYSYLGIVLEYPKPGQRVPTENEKMIEIARFFGQGKKIQVRHFDSMNSDAYHTNVKEGLKIIKGFVDYKPESCSQQVSNTCGDHTTANLFMSGVMNVVPVINSKGTGVTSADLRAVTDFVGPTNRKYEGAITLVCALKNKGDGDEDLLRVTKTNNKNMNAIAKKVNDYVSALRKIDKKMTTDIIRLAALEVRPLEGQSQQALVRKKVAMNQEQTKRYYQLIELFNGTHKIFEKKQIPKEDRVAFGLYAEMIADDICQEWDFKDGAADRKKLEEEARRQEKARLQAVEEERKRNAASKSLALKAAHDKNALSEKNALKKRNTLRDKFTQHIANILEEYKKQPEFSEQPNKYTVEMIDEFRKDIKIREKVINAEIENPGAMTYENIKRLLLLYNFKQIKMAEIKASNIKATKKGSYSQRLNEFHNDAMDILLSKETAISKPQRLTELAEQKFKHTALKLRLLADVLLVISCLFIVGFAIGGYRLSQNKTFFFSQNSAEKQFEKDVIDASPRFVGLRPPKS